MKISPTLIAKITGGIIAIGICAVAFLWLRSTYSIQGNVQIDTGVEVVEARQTDVILIQGFVKEDLDKLVAEYNSFEKMQIENTLNQLLKKSKENAATKKTEKKAEKKTKIKIEKKIKVLDNKNKDNDNEKEIITKRVRKYAENAVYCREEIPIITEGKEFYEAGADFWEEKITNLKDFDKLIVDDASLNYETVWQSTGGLGTEPIQIVRAIIRTNITNVKITEPPQEIPKVKPKKPEKEKIDEVIPGSFLTKKEVMNFALALNKGLKVEYREIARKSSDLILTMTIEQTQTDDKGNFVFKNKVVQPGNYIVYSKFDILSLQGEPVEFMWFTPVNISIKRLAYDKTTILNLNELNQSKPSYLDIYIPETEEIFLKLLDKLEEKIKKPNKEVSESKTIIDELLMAD